MPAPFFNGLRRPLPAKEPLRVSVVDVQLGERSYTIEIGTGNLGALGAHAQRWCQPSHAVIITDENVEAPHAERAAQSLAGMGASVDMLVAEAGEQTKSLDAAAGLWDKLLDLGTDRRSLVVAVGGGVIGDLAGFIAATFARGLAYVQVPTTLLSQVDSSVGGKVGINLAGAKNMVGAFWQPSGVLIDTAVLDSLPPREYRSGLAEVVKYGVILDAAFFAYLEAHVAELTERDPATLEYVIYRSCRLKANVVQGDERELSGAGRAELRPYVLPCAGDGDPLRAVLAWRGRRDRHAVRVAVGRAAGPRRSRVHCASACRYSPRWVCRSSSRTWIISAYWRRCRRTKKWNTDGCGSYCQRPWATSSWSATSIPWTSELP